MKVTGRAKLPHFIKTTNSYQIMVSLRKFHRPLEKQLEQK